MCIRPDEYHLEETPIPDVIEVLLTEQTQAINEVIDLVSDSDTEIQSMTLENIIPVIEPGVDEGASATSNARDPRLQLSSPSSHSIGFKEETLNSKQEDET